MGNQTVTVPRALGLSVFFTRTPSTWTRRVPVGLAVAADVTLIVTGTRAFVDTLAGRLTAICVFALDTVRVAIDDVVAYPALRPVTLTLRVRPASAVRTL